VTPATCHSDRPVDARGLCKRCYERAREMGELIDRPKRLRTAAEFDADYQVLRDLSVDVIAQRMGMTVAGVRKALERARRRRSS
jgi:hypothetical protein